MNTDALLREWRDAPELQRVLALLILFSLLTLLWIQTNRPDLQTVTNVFLPLAIVSLIGFILDYISDKSILEFVGLGTKESLTYAILSAGLLILFISSFGFYIAVPQTSSTSVELASAKVQEDFVFVVIIAPIVEEVFFRMFLTPTLITILSSLRFRRIVGAIAVSILFGLFHYRTYNASVHLMLVAFIFSMISIFGNYMFKSSAFSLTLHFLNNFLVFNAGLV